MKKRSGVAMIFLTLLAGCAAESQRQVPDSSQQQDQQGNIAVAHAEPSGSLTLTSSEVDLQVKVMAQELVESMARRCYKPMAIASFVDIETLNTSSRLGMALAESFITQMQKQGCKVIDFKLRNAIQVTSDGDFVFSRNFNQLKDDLAIDYVLSGTMQAMNDGVQIHARLVEISSKVVIGSAQRFLPESMLGGLAPTSTRDGVPLLKQG
jgi:TolB-like protein